MKHSEPTFPFFIPVASRLLSTEERATVSYIVENECPQFRHQLDGLRVVGRCGCGACPTVFFQPHNPDARDREVASYAGRDVRGGIVGVLLWENETLLTQLEFYSVDAHDPWSIPLEGTLEKY